MLTPRPRTLRIAVAAVAAVLLLVGAVKCGAGDGGESGTDATPSLPSRSVEGGATLDAKPVPMRVAVARVFNGKLRPKQTHRLERQVGRLLSSYFDAAFLGGEYPRKDFPGAFATFSGAAASRARDDMDLLTNAAASPQIERVVPRTKRARLDVLVSKRSVPGLTARVRLVFRQERVRGADLMVTVAGRLLVNKAGPGSWQIFGYDISRSAVPAAKEGRS